MRSLSFLVVGAVVASLVVGLGSNRLGAMLGGIDKSCRGYALARQSRGKELQAYIARSK